MFPRCLKFLLPLLLLSIGAYKGTAQYFDKYYGVAAVGSLPLSNREFINDPSIRGIKLMYRELLNEKLSAGFDFNYSGYKDYTEPRVYPTGNGAVFTDFFGYVDQYSITLSGEYLFAPDKKLIPYLGFGGGASYSSFRLYYNVYQNSERKWSGIIRPYGGAILRFGSKTSWGAFTSLSLDHSFVKAPDFDYKGLASMNLQIGLVYLNW